MHITSILQEPLPAWDTIITRLVKAVDPDKIFRRDSHLMIVFPNSSQTPLNDYKTRIEAGHTDKQAFYYTLYYYNDVQRYLNEGHFLYSTVFVKDNLVYDSGQSPLFLPLLRRIEKTKNKAIHDFTTGYQRAQSLFEGAKFFLMKDDSGLTAFMLHQTAELTMRAVIMALTSQDIKTHVISELNQHCKKCSSRLNFLNSKSELEMRLLDRLEKAYLCTRYTDKYEIAYEDLMLLVARVKQLQTVAKEIFTETLSAFDNIPYTADAVSYSGNFETQEEIELR